MQHYPEICIFKETQNHEEIHFSYQHCDNDDWVS